MAATYVVSLKNNHMDKPIHVTEPFLPPLEEYVDYLKGIWERRQLTNQGPLVIKLEQLIQQSQSLDVPVRLVANGGLGLQIILKAMGIKGEVITTPFSYVATTSCPAWEGCAIRFADIEPEFLTLDPAAVEATITPSTEAILATHSYGNPCDCEGLEKVARKHGLALIYDAAHAYGVRYRGESILSYGDASMVSLHATKLFHSVEGGFVVCQDSAVAEKVEWMRRFGHDGQEAYHGVGINAKMSELHAAMGLCVLPYFDEIMRHRQAVCDAYHNGIKDLAGVRFGMTLRDSTQWNTSYFPVRFESEALLLATVDKLEKTGIFPRRYFHPALHEIGLIGTPASPCPVASRSSRELLCLPLSAQTSQADIERVLDVIRYADKPPAIN
ncbi:MAG: DegT/DnrJ/EryC1/StrS family aminotransferase [Akkermansiaceae bacterium]|jgi:dTDP-4-amino-4,6-dideoxygalactose transaminase